MNCTYRRVLGITLCAGALAFTASRAKAQSTGGDFTFTSQVHWGKTVLQPGKYHMTISGDFSEVRNISVFNSNNRRFAFLAVTRATDEAEGADSYLELVSRNGVNFVHEFDSKMIGAKFVFAVPTVSGQDISMGRERNKTVVALISAAQAKH